LTAVRGLRTAGFWTKILDLRAPTGEQVRIGRREVMRMRTIAPLILGIIVTANFVLGQSLAEVAEKEKERRKNNGKEATLVVKNRGVWLVPVELKPESEDSAQPFGKSENTKPRSSEQEIEECRFAQDSLDDLKRDQRRLETRYLQIRRKAQTARILDTYGYREMKADDWRVSRDEGREILAELTSLRAGLSDANKGIDTYLQKMATTCQ